MAVLAELGEDQDKRNSRLGVLQSNVTRTAVP